MSKYDGDIKAAGPASVVLDDLIVALGGGPRIAANRQDALAQYLSGDDGWRDASARLGGAFAGSEAMAGLTARSDK